MCARPAFLVGILLLIMPFSAAEAEVWVVHPDGTGDMPTIQTAIDICAHSGDIIELTDGIFTGYGNRDLYNMGKSFLIRSQSGNPADCVIDLQGSEDEWHWGIGYDEDG